MDIPSVVTGVGAPCDPAPAMTCYEMELIIDDFWQNVPEIVSKTSKILPMTISLNTSSGDRERAFMDTLTRL